MNPDPAGRLQHGYSSQSEITEYIGRYILYKKKKIEIV